MPQGAAYVGRPTKWGNPFPIGAPHPEHGQPMTRAEVVAVYREFVTKGCLILLDTAEVLVWEASFSLADVRSELRGRDLACWCPVGLPCHADVLLEIANREDAGG
jgi:hypothetical protein